MIRGSPTVWAVCWICPKLALLSAVNRRGEVHVLITLNTSHRNCIRLRAGELERPRQREVVLESCSGSRS
jgi:hypothetical protein